MNKEKTIKVLDMISKDMENDATAFDGKPFTGLTVGTYFGYHGAAIARLAQIIKQIIEEKEVGDERGNA